MYYILIILGITLVTVGIVGLSKGKGPRSSEVEKDREQSVATENGSTSGSVSAIEDNRTADNDGERKNERYDDGLTDAERKGQAFEMFVRDHFSHKEYSLVEHVNDKASHEHVTERSKYPDMVFRHRSSDTKFAVECKYRSDWEPNGSAPQIEWAEKHNIDNYLHFAEERKMDVVIVIGIGGTAENPDEVYAAPLHALKKFTFARKSYLNQFKLSNPMGNYRFILSKHTVVN